MTIRTERLLLRPFEAGDADDLYAYLSDPEVVKFEPYDPFTREQCAQEAVSRAANPGFTAVVLDGHVIGNIWFGQEGEDTYDVGWVFNRAYQGKGYATAAARAVVDDAFRNRGVRRVTAHADPLNPASWRLCERLGMRREGRLVKNVFFKRDEDGNPIWKDTYLYAILAEEWLAR